jgi:WhiB family redox-sensing transcriptional regulator
VTWNATAVHDAGPPIDAPGRWQRPQRPTSGGDRSTVACARDPERWTTSADEGAKALCRACPRRWPCAQQACATPGAEGVWAGILIPAGGRGRQFALGQLRSLAEHHGLTARTG